MSRRDEFEITPATVLRAYSVGLFPMAESADDPTIFWVDPEARGVFPLDALHISRSLAKTVRGDRYEVVVDRDFDAVIDACATREGETWINPSIRRLYRALFDMRAVHTVEARAGGELVGGLYGVAIGGAFFGESMFHRARDASKVAFVHLAARLRKGGWRLLDAQFVTDHLATLGAVEIGRDDYRRRLKEAIAIEPDQSVWTEGAPMSGAAALEAIRAGAV